MERKQHFLSDFIMKKRMIKRVVPVTKEEKEQLLKKYPDLSVARTMRQDSKRKHYFCEERPGAMAYLQKLRQQGVIYTSEPRDLDRRERRRR